MTSSHTQRTCGNCGAPANPSAVTCPACDALLAAYDAPAGLTTNGAPSAFDIIPASTTTTSPSVTGRSAAGTHAPSRPFSAEQALAEARRTLGMSLEQSPASRFLDGEKDTEAHKPEATTPAARPKSPRHLRPDSTTSVTASRSTPRSRTETNPAGRTPQPPGAPTVAPTAPGISAVPDSGHHTAVEIEVPRSSAYEIGTTLANLFRLLPAFLIFVIFLKFMSPLGMSLFFVVVVAIILLMQVMKIAANASGRKTTSMPRYDRRDPWR